MPCLNRRMGLLPMLSICLIIKLSTGATIAKFLHAATTPQDLISPRAATTRAPTAASTTMTPTTTTTTRTAPTFRGVARSLPPRISEAEYVGDPFKGTDKIIYPPIVTDVPPYRLHQYVKSMQRSLPFTKLIKHVLWDFSPKVFTWKQVREYNNKGVLPNFFKTFQTYILSQVLVCLAALVWFIGILMGTHKLLQMCLAWCRRRLKGYVKKAREITDISELEQRELDKEKSIDQVKRKMKEFRNAKWKHYMFRVKRVFYPVMTLISTLVLIGTPIGIFIGVTRLLIVPGKINKILELGASDANSFDEGTMQELDTVVLRDFADAVTLTAKHRGHIGDYVTKFVVNWYLYQSSREQLDAIIKEHDNLTREWKSYKQWSSELFGTSLTYPDVYQRVSAAIEQSRTDCTAAVSAGETHCLYLPAARDPLKYDINRADLLNASEVYLVTDWNEYVNKGILDALEEYFAMIDGLPGRVLAVTAADDDLALKAMANLTEQVSKFIKEIKTKFKKVPALVSKDSLTSLLAAYTVPMSKYLKGMKYTGIVILTFSAVLELCAALTIVGMNTGFGSHKIRNPKTRKKLHQKSARCLQASGAVGCLAMPIFLTATALIYPIVVGNLFLCKGLTQRTFFPKVLDRAGSPYKSLMSDLLLVDPWIRNCSGDETDTTMCPALEPITLPTMGRVLNHCKKNETIYSVLKLNKSSLVDLEKLIPMTIVHIDIDGLLHRSLAAIHALPDITKYDDLVLNGMNLVDKEWGQEFNFRRVKDVLREGLTVIPDTMNSLIRDITDGREWAQEYLGSTPGKDKYHMELYHTALPIVKDYMENVWPKERRLIQRHLNWLYSEIPNRYRDLHDNIRRRMQFPLMTHKRVIEEREDAILISQLNKGIQLYKDSLNSTRRHILARAINASENFIGKCGFVYDMYNGLVDRCFCQYFLNGLVYILCSTFLTGIFMGSFIMGSLAIPDYVGLDPPPLPNPKEMRLLNKRHLKIQKQIKLKGKGEEEFERLLNKYKRGKIQLDRDKLRQKDRKERKDQKDSFSNKPKDNVWDQLFFS